MGQTTWRPASLLGLVLLLLSLLLAAPARAGFADGVAAYEAGDYGAAYQAWLPLAEGGDVAAMRNVGHLYRWGQGVEKNVMQAMTWYRRAAETGFARAQANLAAIYLQGDEGVPIDYAEARKWFEAAAKQGHAVAQYNLGLMYELGLGVEKNEPVALGWYNNAAKAGQPDALERLSLLVIRRDAPPAPAAAAPAAAVPAAPHAVQADDKTENAAADVQTAPAPQPAPIPAPAPVASEPAPPAAAAAAPSAPAAPAEDDRPGLLGRFYSAIASGGGVSIPDIFTGREDEPPAGGAATEPKP